MARFTFGRGNAAKLLRLPLYAVGALTTVVVPRSRKLWVVGSGVGLGEGALPLYRRARAVLPDDVRLVWLASTDRELTDARAAGLDAEPKRGWRGFRLTLRARVAVVTHGFGDVNRYAVRGAIVVQLWHGIPLKRLHLDTDAALRVAFLPNHRLVRALMGRAYRLSGRMIGVFPVTSDAVAARIRSAFGLRADQVVVTGDPRDDVLLAGGPAARDERRATARAALEEAVGELPEGRVVLYAPTWRDGAPDPAAPTTEEWHRIAIWLADHDATLLVRSHPLGEGGYDEGPSASERIRLLESEWTPDVTPLLPAIDDLVTDYSSIAYDHALGGGRTVFFAPDLEQYGKSRGLYEAYRDFTGGRHETDWNAVLERLGENPATTAAHTSWLVGEHHDLLDGRATDRVLAAVLRRAGSPVPDELTAAESQDVVARPRVASASLADGDTPTLSIELIGLPADVIGVRLQGARARVDAPLVRRANPATGTTGPGGATVPRDATEVASARLPLLGTRWGAARLALPSGDYRVLLVSTDAEPSSRLTMAADPEDAGPGARTGSSTGTSTATRLEHPLFHARVGAVAGGLELAVSPPLADDERGAQAQRRRYREYLGRVTPVEDAVFFESFYGRTVACNPLGIDRALARLRPETRRYWSVIDASFPVPTGAERLIEGSREWWRVRGAARLLVVNDWLRKRWRRRPHQRVLQTWHGTMIKRLAIDRPKVGLRTRLAVHRESGRWDALLAQNSYAAEIFRSAYAFRKPIWLEGYPRNDVLVDGDPAAVRARLGLRAGTRVILYAPTWRDDRTEMVDYLDLERFADELPAGDVLLVRGHSRTLPFGRDLHGSRLLDVTGYPDVADLLLVADVLITDYSSVMFDFASTERPIVFFAPDLQHYSEDLRGFYFDLLSEAPGPVVHTREALLDALGSIDTTGVVFDGARTAWRERFAPHDDGSAGERVVRRLLDEGMLG